MTIVSATRYAPQTCTACGGQGGRTETEVGGDGVTRQTWRSCGACGGSGRR